MCGRSGGARGWLEVGADWIGEVGRWHRGERNIWKNSRDAGSLGGKKNRLRAPNLITRRKIILLAAINHVLINITLVFDSKKG